MIFEQLVTIRARYDLLAICLYLIVLSECAVVRLDMDLNDSQDLIIIIIIVIIVIIITIMIIIIINSELQLVHKNTGR